MHSTALERPWREDARAAGTVGLAHMTSHFFQLLLPPIYPLLMKDFGIGFTEAGFLATVFFLISSCGQAIAGFAVDRFGAYRILQAGVATLACAGLALGLSHSYSGVVVTAAIAGLGNAIFHPADYTILNRRVSPSRLGHAFAMHGLTGSLGWVAGSSFMAGMATLAGWHVAGFGAALVALASLAVLSTQRSVLDGTHLGHARVELAAESRAESTAESTAAAAVGVQGLARTSQFAFLGSATVWLCFAFFFLSTGAGGILQNFAPAILGHVYAISAVLATLCLTSYLVGGATGTIIGGFVAGRERRSSMVVALALCLAAAVSLLLASGWLPATLLVPALFILGCGTGSAGPSRDLLVRHAATARFGSASFGRVYGFVYSGVDGGLAAMPLIVGRILDQGMFASGLLCIAALQVAAIFVAMRVGRET